MCLHHSSLRKSHYGGKATWWGRACPIRPWSPLRGSRDRRLLRARWSRPPRKRAARGASPLFKTRLRPRHPSTVQHLVKQLFLLPPTPTLTHGRCWDEEGRLTWTLEQFAWGLQRGFRRLVCRNSFFLLLFLDGNQINSLSHFVTKSLSCKTDLMK